MNGRLGAWELYSNVSQAVYACDKTVATTLNLNICNRNNGSAFVSVALSTSATAPANAEWIEYDIELLGKGVLERTGIVVSPGQYLVVKSNINRVNAVCWGITMGTEFSVAPVVQNLGDTPSWVTAATLPDVGANESQAIQLVATNPNNQTLSYAVTSGSLPTGLSLSSTTGLISGTPTLGTYSPGGSEPTSFTATAFDELNSVPRLFSITKKWFDGSSSALAARSASHIKTMTGTTTNGAYWINTGSGPVQTYCLMSVGGGYMLAAKIAANSTPVNDWSFNGQNWTKTTVVNESAIANISAGDAVGRAYFEHTCRTGYAMALATVTNVLTFPRAGLTPRVAFTQGAPYELAPYLTRGNFMTWIATAGTPSSNWDNQPNANNIRMNTVNEISGVGMRFGITMNNEDNNTSNDSAIGFGTYTNNDVLGVRNVSAGGHRWSPDTRYPYQGFIFVD